MKNRPTWMCPDEERFRRTERVKAALSECIGALEEYYCHCRELFCEDWCENGMLVEKLKKQLEEMKEK